MAIFFSVFSAATSAAAPTEVRVGFLRDGHYTVVTMPLETYVSRVLAGEAARNSEPAALEALAITIRTFALANRSRHRADGFDLCDQTHCQVVRTATGATDRAASATAGQVLMHGSGIASIYYTASCGGRTELPSAVWPGAEDPSYLPSKRDGACAGTPEWAAELTANELERALSRAGYRGDLHDVRIAGRDPSGRVSRLRLEGMTPPEISGQDLRVVVGRTLGWQHIMSTAFDLRSEGRGHDRMFAFAGHGSGHGVGLCVIGSARLAAAGESARAILDRYFPGLTIASPVSAVTTHRSEPARRTDVAAAVAPATPVPAPAADLLLSLPDDDEGERRVITQMALSARDDLARTLGVAPPPRITVRFHGTVDDYSRATGQPWFTSAALLRNEMHLAPLTILRGRGVLERTIRRELVHLLIDGQLSGRPAWVREGAAIYFSDITGANGSMGRASPQPGGKCPSESELTQPISAGALASAYARARACFEKKMTSGKSWKEVK